MGVVPICGITEISPHDCSNADINVCVWMSVCAHVVCKNISMHTEFVTPGSLKVTEDFEKKKTSEYTLALSIIQAYRNTYEPPKFACVRLFSSINLRMRIKFVIPSDEMREQSRIPVHLKITIIF
jgi:hypothetical protein